MKYWQSIVALSLTLSACSAGTVKNTLGLERSPPDEYRVVSRPPLSVPPDFTLRPPASFEAAPNQQPVSQAAQSMMLSGDKTSGTPATNKQSAAGKSDTGDSEFLKNAGATSADPNVRNALAEDRYAQQQALEQKSESSWWDPTSWWSDDVKKDPTVDATKETDRIKQNADAGKPVTTGDTPDEKTPDTGVLGRIFGN